MDGHDQNLAFARLHELDLPDVVEKAGLNAAGQVIRDAFMKPFRSGDGHTTSQNGVGETT